MLQLVIKEINGLTQAQTDIDAFTPMGETGLDSLSFVALCVNMEEKLDISLGDEFLDIYRFESIAEYAGELEKEYRRQTGKYTFEEESE